MTPDDVRQETGCDLNHKARQQCNGPTADARRAAHRQALEAAQARPLLLAEDPVLPWWLTTPRIGAALELLPGIAVAVVWLGSRTESVHYHDFGNLHLLALLPPVGWIWRGSMGCITAPFIWFARLSLILVAAIFWAHAGGHSVVMFDDCCLIPDETVRWRTASIIGMHAALLACMAVSVTSAYGVSRGKPGILNLTD